MVPGLIVRQFRIDLVGITIGRVYWGRLALRKSSPACSGLGQGAERQTSCRPTFSPTMSLDLDSTPIAVYPIANRSSSLPTELSAPVFTLPSPSPVVQRSDTTCQSLLLSVVWSSPGSGCPSTPIKVRPIGCTALWLVVATAAHGATSSLRWLLRQIHVDRNLAELQNVEVTTRRRSPS